MRDLERELKDARQIGKKYEDRYFFTLAELMEARRCGVYSRRDVVGIAVIAFLFGIAAAAVAVSLFP